MTDKKDRKSKTGMGETIETPEPKKAGRQKKDEDKAYQEYVTRMENRIHSGEKKPDGTELAIFSMDEWKSKNRPSGETPEEKAIRLGEKRLQNAIDSISLVENLSAPQYSVNEAQVKIITESLQKAVDSVKNAFSKTVKVPETKISLKV